MLPLALAMLLLAACLGVVRVSGLGLHKGHRLWRVLLALVVGMGGWLVLLAYGVEWERAHTREVVTIWCVDNRFALRSFRRCDADGRPVSRRPIWQRAEYYRLTPMGKGPAKILLIGNWFTGNLSNKVTVIR